MLEIKRIKEQVSISQVLDLFNISVNSNSFAVCPFHSENTASLKIYDKSNTFNCFGCGQNGDILDFYRHIKGGITLHQSLNELQGIFGLSDNKATYSEKYTLNKKILTQKSENVNKINKFNVYRKAIIEYDRLSKNFQKYKPTEFTEDLHPLFIEALQGLATAEIMLEIKQMEVI